MGERTLRCVCCDKSLEDEYDDEMCFECLALAGIAEEEEDIEMFDMLEQGGF